MSYCLFMKRTLLSLISLLFVAVVASAQNFDNDFKNETLRLDYTFSGNADLQMVSLKEIMSQPGWMGRRCNLDSVPLRGNGQLSLYDKESGRLIYEYSFSSLFQEWLVTPEAKGANRSFEATFMVPAPQREVRAEIVLMNNKGEEQARLEHTIRPDDALIRDLAPRKSLEWEYIHRGGDSKECIDVVILAEGYTAEQMELFMRDAKVAAEEILSYKPFSEYSSNFNFIAVKSLSESSAVSVPQDDLWCQTAVNTNFMTFYMPRYLTTGSVHKLYDLVTNIPCEHLVVLANTDTYGGGGIYNSYTLTTAHHPAFKPVVVHEFGHSFGGLGDEYFYDTPDMVDETYSLQHEPWEPNITTRVDFLSKWADMLPAPGVIVPTEPTEERKQSYEVGLYEGGGYRTHGIFRPAVVCRMRDNVAERFCPVCERSLERVIRFHLVEE